jgi:hypothetical protein
VVEFIREVDTRCQRILAPHRRRVLVNAQSVMEYPVVAPVYKAMRGDERVTFYFTSSKRPDNLQEIYGEVGDAKSLISPGRAALMKFDAYLTADMKPGRLIRGSRRVQMFHGVAGKYANVYDAPTRSMRYWYRIFFINQRRLRNFVAAGAIDPGSPAARLVGMPKVDSLVDGTYERDSTLHSLGLDPGRPTVLYAPTWSKHSSLHTVGVDLIESLGAAGFTVIVKLHENSRVRRDYHSGGVEWEARLEPVLRSRGGHLAKGSNANPYLVAADVLITDHSSVGFEYMLLDRPVVRVYMPELIANANIHPDYVSLLAEASITIREAAEVVTTVESCMSDPGRTSASRRAVAEELFYKPGTATARAVKELYDVLELDPAPFASSGERGGLPDVPAGEGRPGAGAKLPRGSATEPPSPHPPREMPGAQQRTSTQAFS